MKIKKIIAGFLAVSVISTFSLCVTASAFPSRINANLKSNPEYVTNTYTFSSEYSYTCGRLTATLANTNNAKSVIQTASGDSLTAYVCIWNSNGTAKVDNASSTTGKATAEVNPIMFTPVRSHHEGTSSTYNTVYSVLCN